MQYFYGVLMSSSTKDAVLSGLNMLRTSALLLIVTVLLLGVASVALMLLFFIPTSVTVSGVVGGINYFREVRHLSPLVITAALSFLTVAIVAVILLLISIYFYLIPSAKQFTIWRPLDFSTPSKLMRLGYVGGALTLLTAFILLIIAVVSGFFVVALLGIVLVIAGFILLLIGRIGVIIFFFRLRDAFNSTLFLITAILLMISLVITFIPVISVSTVVLELIAWVLVLIEVGSLRDKITSGAIQL